MNAATAMNNISIREHLNIVLCMVLLVCNGHVSVKYGHFLFW